MWVVSVHSCGGSTAEAIAPAATFGVDTEKTAEELASKLQEVLDRLDRYGEWFVHYFEVIHVKNYALPQLTGAALQASLKEQGLTAIPAGHVALDVEELGQKIIDGEEIELLPPEVDPSEEAAAIASILGEH